MAKKAVGPLTEEELLSVYRNDFYEVDNPQYFNDNRTRPERKERTKYYEYSFGRKTYNPSSDDDYD